MLSSDLEELALKLSPEDRQALLRYLRRQGKIPQVYQLLAWAGGWCGAHLLYLGRARLGLAHAATFAIACGFLFYAIAQLHLTSLCVAGGLFAALGIAWAIGIVRAKPIIQAHRLRLEHDLAAKLCAALTQVEAQPSEIPSSSRATA